MTDADIIRKVLHTLGRPTQPELDAGLAAVARMEATTEPKREEMYRVEGLVRNTTEVAWIKGQGLWDMAVSHKEAHALIDNPPLGFTGAIRITPVVRCPTCPAYIPSYETHVCAHVVDGKLQ